MSAAFGTKWVVTGQDSYYDPWGNIYYYDSYGYKPRLPLAPALFLGLPLAAIANNLTWRTSALSGASQTLNYRLINENPEIDLFFYPKYYITYQRIFSPEGIQLKYLFIQSASVNAKVTGASLNH